MSTKKKKICVLGMGYIGLPTASMFSTHGFKVHGVDINPKVIEKLRKGEVHIEEPGLATVVKAAISSKNLTIDDKPAAADVFIIAVPTPCHKSKSGLPKADMTFVEKAMTSILPHLKSNNLVILESTSPPGTTRDLIVPMIEKAGLRPGKEVGVAYCPERVIPGRALEELVGNDRVVGAINERWGKETRSLYKSFVSGQIFLTDPTVAEMVKLLENTYRDVNIALANEVSVLCENLGISVWDVIKIANRHPRVHVHQPGPGVGGHCISVDPWFLAEKFPKDTPVIQMARKINDERPKYVTKEIAALVRTVNKPKIAILGVAYKANVDDTRESPALEVLALLKKGHPDFKLAVFDPYATLDDFPKKTLNETLSGADLIVVLTAHEDFRLLDPNKVADIVRSKIIYDTHQALPVQRWVTAGFDYHAVGLGAPGTARRSFKA